MHNLGAQIFGLDLGLEGGRALSKSTDVSGYQGRDSGFRARLEHTEHNLKDRARLGAGLCPAELLAHTSCLENCGYSTICFFLKSSAANSSWLRKTPMPVFSDSLQGRYFFCHTDGTKRFKFPKTEDKVMQNLCGSLHSFKSHM